MPTKKILLFLMTIVATVICNTALAQSTYDNIYLKNGSIIKGIIIEQVPGKSIKVETRDKNIFVFKEEEIEKIVKGPMQRKGRDESEEERNTEPRVYSSTEAYTGYSFGIETGIGPGSSARNQNGLGLAFHVLNNATFKSKFSCGIGLGFDLFTLGYSPYENETYYDDYARSYLNMTYYLDLRAFPIEGKISPLIICNAGYGTTLFSSKVTGGLYFNGGVGTRFRFTNKFALNLTLNYKMQKFSYQEYFSEYTYTGTYPNGSYVYNNYTIKEKFTLEYLNVVIGLSF